MKQKLKSYSFWVGILSGIGLIAKEILDATGIAIEQALIDQIVSVVLAVACVSGVIAPAKTAAVGSSESMQGTESCPITSDAAEGNLQYEAQGSIATQPTSEQRDFAQDESKTVVTEENLP